MAKREELRDEQWAILEPLIPKVVLRADGHGRPAVHGDRAVNSAHAATTSAQRQAGGQHCQILRSPALQEDQRPQ